MAAMAAAAPFISLGTSVLGALGKRNEGRAADTQAQAEALAIERRSEVDAASLERQAALEQVALRIATETNRREKARESGDILAAFGSRGVDLGSTEPTSAPLLLLSESAFEFDNLLNIETFNTQARIGELNYQAKVAKQEADYQASLRRFGGAQARSAGITSALGGLFSSGLRFAEQNRNMFTAAAPAAPAVNPGGFITGPGLL